ncbi:MAG TPA: hypothetical protein VMN76_07785 [Acidobacteriota bacterium]|nr:hypothetical protein [Acidobacteriota bacterium]
MEKYTALTAMLGRVVDYAGTFPPARLSLEDALAVAARFRRTGRFPWLLKRVALTLDAARSLTPAGLYSAGADGSAWELAVLGSEPESDPLVAIAGDLDAIAQLIGQFRSCSMELLVSSYETRAVFDAVAACDRREIGGLTAGLGELLKNRSEMAVSLEVPARGDSFEGLQALLAAARSAPLRIGIKVRTGGDAAPDPGELAAAISVVSQQACPFKATQGLHAPISANGSFGFVNLLAALNLAFSFRRCSVRSLQSCLSDSDASAFRFEKERFRWRDLELPASRIESARKAHQGCFGSCSIEEPDQLLHQFLSTTGIARKDESV